MSGFRKFRKSSSSSQKSWDGRHRFEHWYHDNQVYFMTYHQEADGQHTGDLEAILTSEIVDDAAADDIVRCAQVVARLYALQLEELDR